MMDHLMLFVIVAVFALFYWVYYTASRKGACTANWETLPTREQYLAAHPGAADGDLIFCIHCGHLSSGRSAWCTRWITAASTSAPVASRCSIASRSRSASSSPTVIPQ